MQIDNIMKVADIDYRSLLPATVSFFETSGEVTYRDNILKEDIYNIEEIQLAIEEHEPPAEVSQQLLKLHELLDKKECSYLRITY